MRESTARRAIVAEGARRMLLTVGREYLGPPDAAAQATLDAITDAEQLNTLGKRLLDVASWEELLSGRAPRRGTGRGGAAPGRAAATANASPEWWIKESLIYRHLVAEGYEVGRLQEARRLILLLGHEFFGTPDAATPAVINAIADIEPLERMGRHLLKAGDWRDLPGMTLLRLRHTRRHETDGSRSGLIDHQPNSLWEDSSTYRQMREQGGGEGAERGRLDEARRFVLLLGRQCFGAPDVDVRTQLDIIDHLEDLEQKALRLPELSSWREVLRMTAPAGSSRSTEEPRDLTR